MADPPELAEDVDLEDAHKRYVLELHARLASLDHYQVLGLARGVDKKAVKRAYFALAATMHPDRYFGKRLGSYKAKMEAIFARISTAFTTLDDDDQRAAYDARLASGAAPAVKAPLDPQKAAQQKAAMDALKQRFTDGKAKAKQHLDAAARAKAAGDFIAAADAYRAALAISPNDAEIKAAFEEAQRAAAERLVESNKKKAILEERFGRWAEAADAWQRVLLARPDDLEVRERLAQALARAARGG